MLTTEQKKVLIGIAKKSIETRVRFEREYKPAEPDPALSRPSGVFVTLKKRGELRGCIGYIEAVTPLQDSVAKMAVEAAAHDPRFVPVAESELGDIGIEISVLSPLRRIADVNEIETGRHGLFVKRGFYSGLLLPQVAVEYNWNREEFLGHTCNKAGMPSDAWRKGAEIYVFTAEVFKEE